MSIFLCFVFHNSLTFSVHFISSSMSFHLLYTYSLLSSSISFHLHYIYPLFSNFHFPPYSRAIHHEKYITSKSREKYAASNSKFLLISLIFILISLLHLPFWTSYLQSEWGWQRVFARLEPKTDCKGTPMFQKHVIIFHILIRFDTSHAQQQKLVLSL